MNKYTELSDFEINKKVAEGLDYEFTVNGRFIFISANAPQGIVPYSVIFDPCNNPSDAMPIIIENKISSVPQINGDLWICGRHPLYVTTNNLYRAAMICFLLMKDAENEKV